MYKAAPDVIGTFCLDLGEGPVWVERDQCLWFTDIKRQKIHRYDPATGHASSWSAPSQVGFVVPASDGGFIAGLQSGLHCFDPQSGTFTLLRSIDADRPGNRLNDGTVDPAGAIWFGTMDDSETQASGRYYRYFAGQLSNAGIAGIAITNGPCVSPDGRLIYLVDTLKGIIFRSEISDEGVLLGCEPFIKIPGSDGKPDGPTIDSEGCIWVGLYGGWEVRRYSPTGNLLRRIRFPVSNVTKITFAGANMMTAYATTARHLLTPSQLVDQPLAGSLFAFDAGVSGLIGNLAVV
jgi:xylono-1,5-lactonase